MGHRESAIRRKQNLSMLVGKEATTAQEQIVSSSILIMNTRKGECFHLKTEKGGGNKGKGKGVHIGKVQEKTQMLPSDMFKKIKNNLVLSKKKMAEVCKTY